LTHVRILEVEAAKLVQMLAEIVVLRHTDGFLHDHRRERVALTFRDPLEHVRDGNVQDPLEVLQLAQPEVPLVRQVRRPEDNGGACAVVDENAPVPVEDHAALRLDPDRAELVALRNAEVLVARENLERPKAEEQRAEHEQHDRAEDRDPQGRLGSEPVGLLDPRIRR
jgi:hypothetical protein